MNENIKKDPREGNAISRGCCLGLFLLFIWEIQVKNNLLLSRYQNDYALSQCGKKKNARYTRILRFKGEFVTWVFTKENAFSINSFCIFSVTNIKSQFSSNNVGKITSYKVSNGYIYSSKLESLFKKFGCGL